VADHTLSISRQDLYEAVWTTPTYKLAKKFGYSDAGLAKLCNKHNIPRPGSAYWHRRDFGREVSRTPLPEAEGAKGSVDQYGVLRPHIKDVLSRDQSPFYVRVTPNTLLRGVRVLNALLCALEERGCGLSWPEEAGSKLAVLVEGEQVLLRISETVRRRRHIRSKNDPPWPPDFDNLPTGLFTIYLQSAEFDRLLWKREDRRHRKIEDRLGEIVVAFSPMALAIKKKREEEDRERRERELQRKLEQDADQKVQLYLGRVEFIKKVANSFELSRRIRRLISHIRQATKHETDPDLAARIDEMLAWCARYANSEDRTSPLKFLVEDFFKTSRPKDPSSGTLHWSGRTRSDLYE
jgi:hypothetical protein